MKLCKLVQSFVAMVHSMLGGTYTSESNALFDIWLEKQNPLSAIRDLEAVTSLASDAGIKLLENIEMPANNKLLVLEKI